jgi:hypothetical protein
VARFHLAHRRAGALGHRVLGASGGIILSYAQQCPECDEELEILRRALEPEAR